MTKIDFEELSEWTWAIRELPSSIEGLFINDEIILAGDKEGNIVCWNHEGEIKWKQKVGTRVENFALTKNTKTTNLFLVAGLELIGLNFESGEIKWKVELEGISDWVTIDEINNRIVATSSVFDIEYYDFIEGSYWIFSFDGELLTSEKMDEKAWHLYSNENGVLLGLGRPKNGILKIRKDKKEHFKINDSPICCGFENIFGHANGTISISKKKEIITQEICNTAINAIHIQKDCYLISNQSGDLYCKDQEKSKWTFHSNETISLVNSISSPNKEMVFASTRTDGGSKFYLLDLNSGKEIIASQSQYSIRTTANIGNMLLLGFEDGKILIFEADLLLRRLKEKKEFNPNDNERKKMLDKLRKLRK
ncbi:MAG: hypothetical protein CMB64_02850 [Euryarchaeota archaeon]|nr:hypothetical protein [Euryarchaeota archaeon]|tara:strand:+ start:3291 stop:4385 length:1095 start_codon:yes stop_codon:yes gene_type:complete